MPPRKKKQAKRAATPAASAVRDYDKPVRMETNRQVPLDCLLPYLAMGFTSQNTPGNRYQCGAYALAMSFNAANFLLRYYQSRPNTDDPPSIPKVAVPYGETDNNEIIDILGSQEYRTEVDNYLAANDPSTFQNRAQEKRRRDDMFRKDWLDSMQLECVLEILNRRHDTDFVLGIITGGWQGRLNRDTKEWDSDFFKLTDPNLPTDGEERANRQVVWIIYNNVNVKEHSQRGSRRNQDHWEGFAPPSRDFPSDRHRVTEVQNYRVGQQVDEDVTTGVFIAIQNLQTRMRPQLDAQAGAFLRPAIPKRAASRRHLGIYLRACSGNEGYADRSQVRAIIPHLVRPSAATDASIVAENDRRGIPGALDPQTEGPADVVEETSKAEIGTWRKIQFFYILNEKELHDTVPADHETNFPIRGFELPAHGVALDSTTTIPNPGTAENNAFWVINEVGRSGHVWQRRLGLVKPPFGLKGELYTLPNQASLQLNSDLKDVRPIAKSLGISIARKKKADLILEINEAIVARNSRGHVLKLYAARSDISPSETQAEDLQESVYFGKGELVLQCGGNVAKKGNVRIRDFDGNEGEVSGERLTLVAEPAWGLRLGLVSGKGFPFLPPRNAKKEIHVSDEGSGGEGGDTGNQSRQKDPDVVMGENGDSEGDESEQGSKGDGGKGPDGDVEMGNTSVEEQPEQPVVVQKDNGRRTRNPKRPRPEETPQEAKDAAASHLIKRRSTRNRNVKK